MSKYVDCLEAFEKLNIFQRSHLLNIKRFIVIPSQVVIQINGKVRFLQVH
jgi:hypothetical protein